MPEDRIEPVRFPEREHYGCVNCGSTNHTTGDPIWCEVEKERQRDRTDLVCVLCGKPGDILCEEHR